MEKPRRSDTATVLYGGLLGVRRDGQIVGSCEAEHVKPEQLLSYGGEGEGETARDQGKGKGKWDCFGGVFCWLETGCVEDDDGDGDDCAGSRKGEGGQVRPAAWRAAHAFHMYLCTGTTWQPTNQPCKPCRDDQNHPKRSSTLYLSIAGLSISSCRFRL